MKGRLHEPPLLQMRLAFGGEQSLAEQPLRAFERASFLEQPRARDEHVLDVIGMIQQREPLRSHAERRDVAVRSRDVRQRGEAIAAQRAIEAETEEPFGWAGGQAHDVR